VSPCKNEGVCEKDGEQFVCKCSGDWTGDTCEIEGELTDNIIIKKKLNKMLLGKIESNFVVSITVS
jgi:hypothetical protein